MNYEFFGVIFTLCLLATIFVFITLTQFNPEWLPQIAETTTSQNTTMADYCAKLNINC